MSVLTNFVDIYSQGMRDRSMRSGTELAREIKLTDWSTAGNLSNRSSGVQIPRDICTRIKRYLYSAKCSWIIDLSTRHSVGITTEFVGFIPQSLILRSIVLGCILKYRNWSIEGQKELNLHFCPESLEATL